MESSLTAAAAATTTASRSKNPDQVSASASYQHDNLDSLNLLAPLNNQHINDDGDDDDDFFRQEWNAKQTLLAKADKFTIAYDAHRGYRSTELQFRNTDRPHMRAFYASWICCFTSCFVQFSQAPLLPAIAESLNLSKRDIWFTNVWMMVGGIPVRFLLGPLCDKYGSARSIVTLLLAAVAVPTALTGVVAVNLTWLTMIRTVTGAMDSFVPCQYWITCQFVREVGGTAMAVAGGLGASGSAVTQLVTGSLIFPIIRHLLDGDSDAAWRWSLTVPAVLALGVAYFFYYYSDDYPLGNVQEMKRVGLMMERSAVDSFRSGVFNLNSWILFLQFAGSCGVDFTMCNGAAIYFHHSFGVSIAASGAIAFLYGISAVFARGLGGWLSDAVSVQFSLRGRLYAQFVCLILQGLLNIWFARSDQLSMSIVSMVVFSIVVQMSMGTCFGIVPYVDGPHTGSVAGIVGAGGNVGAALLGCIFMTADYADALEYMGWATMATALLTPLIVVKGYKGIVFGHEDYSVGSDSSKHQQHSPLLVPGKLNKSPHLVSLHARKQRPQMEPAMR
jgi:NNP family nitrate/nitrite transporter-like MFS transporter